MATRPKRDSARNDTVVRRLTPMSDSEFELFYRRVFLPLVRRATWKHRLSKEDARDLVQDAFVVALGKLDGGRNPNAWLIQVVDHLAINFRRKTLRRAALIHRWHPGATRAPTNRSECKEVED